LLLTCATVDATSTQYVGALPPLPGDSAKVAILRAEPLRAYDWLGEIVVDASIDRAPPIMQVEDKLRVEAVRLGADAVAIVLDRVKRTTVYVADPWWGRSAETITGRTPIGIAIKYR
jgi:hypothetical protein